MKRFVLIIATAFISSLGLATPQAEARELAKPEYIALYFYADWCAGCQILSPKLERVREEQNLNRENILFVKLDLTDKPRIHQSILLAQALGVGDFLKQQGSATGYIAVLDIASQEEKLRFNSGDTIEDIQSGLLGLKGHD